jgi:hypothetical protein
MNDYSNIAKDLAEGTARDNLRHRSATEHGTKTGLPIVHRFVIIDVLFDPATIDRTKLDYWEHDLGVANMQHATVAPRNSIIAKRVQSNNTTSAEQTLILYPFLPPNISLPCQPGEHVWVMFEDPEGTRNDLGYWMWRIVGPSHVEDMNHTHPHRAHDASFTPGTRDAFDGTKSPKYEFRNGSVGEIESERYTIAESASLPDMGVDAYEKLIVDSDGGRVSKKEPVPRYKKRPSDVAIEGSNNALIVLGRDRTAKIADYIDDARRGKLPSLPSDEIDLDGAGSVDIVVGRGQTTLTGGKSVKNSLDKNELGKSVDEVVVNEGDPDLVNDRSRVRVSQRARIDLNMGIDSFNSAEFSIEDREDGDSAIVLKTDKLRLIARSDIELIVTAFERDENGNMKDVTDQSKWAAIVIKSDGSIVIRPAANNVIKLGGDDADKPILCSDIPATNVDGIVQGPPIISTMGGQIGGSIGDKGALAGGQGRFSSKVLIK